MFEYILFDLDGTITDSGRGITNSVAYALDKMGIEEPDHTKLYRFVGPPLVESFRRFYGVDQDRARQGVVYYREYYTKQGIFENEVYEGVREMLETLQKTGRKLVLATSKPEVFARQIMEHFDLSDYFTYIGGAELDETRTTKAEVIRYVLEACNVTDLTKVLMVGDREQDVRGAHSCGLSCLGVLYGYGSREELETAGAEYIAETPQEILQYV